MLTYFNSSEDKMAKFSLPGTSAEMPLRDFGLLF